MPGANLAALYVGRHPERVGRLALITPSVTAVGITITGDLRLDTARLREGEPRFPGGFAALEAISAPPYLVRPARPITAPPPAAPVR